MMICRTLRGAMATLLLLAAAQTLHGEPALSNQALLQDRSLRPLQLPERSQGRFRAETTVQREDGIEMRRTAIRGPVNVEVPMLGDWTPAPAPDSRFGLHLVRHTNPDIHLGISWIRKPPGVHAHDGSLWRHARHLLDRADREVSIGIRTPYPPQPETRPLNVLGRVPWALEYEVTFKKEEKAVLVRETFLEFETHFLVFTLISPEPFFQANTAQVQGALAYAALTGP